MISPPRLANVENCPKIENHTACPTGYIQWHSWADRMSKTHRSTRCPDCGFYAIWIQRLKARAS